MVTAFDQTEDQDTVSQPAPNFDPCRAFPLTALQQGMVYHSLAAPQQGLYVQQLIGELREPIDVANFERAWKQLVRRHTILRTSVAREIRETPMQVVHSEIKPHFEQFDWRDHLPAEQEQKREDFLDHERQRGIDIYDPPLFRLTIFQLGHTHFEFVLTSHHAMLDGPSRLILVQELFEIYQSMCEGREPCLPDPIPFQAFVDWLPTTDLDAASRFWKKLLADFDEPTVLDLARCSVAESSPLHSVEKLIRPLSAALSDRLRTMVAEHSLTLNTLFQGAWAILLSRYCGQQKVIFGATRTGRVSLPPEIQKAIGLLINSVPVPVKVDPEAHIVPWLQQLRALWLAMRKHEQTPLFKIQQWCDLPAGTPMFETLMVFESQQLNSYFHQLGDQWRNRTFQRRMKTNFPLVVNVYDGPEIVLEIEHNTERFSSDTIHRMVDHFESILQGFVDRPEQTLCQLSLMTPTERQQVLVEWNQTKAEFPHDKYVHQLFEEQVERTPTATAVVFENEQLTFHELNERANQLAHHLQTFGVGPETLVGIFLDRSLEMVVSILAVLKAGGAYLPLDENNPPQRLALMLEDSQIAVLITNQRLTNRMSAFVGQRVVVDSEREAIARYCKLNFESRVYPYNSAYVIYTSGSTGVPKGAVIHHRGLVNYLYWAMKRYAANEGIGAPVHSPLGFDLTVTSLFLPLLAGRTVFLLPEGPEQLAESHRVHRDFSLTKLTPSHLELLGQILLPGEMSNRSRMFVIGGEALTAEALTVWRQHAPNTRLINEYGPTETVVGCCVYEVTNETPTSGPVPIGRPIANMQTYVLDERRCPVPIGVPGELYIGGIGVARGYLNRPELTAEKFVNHSFDGAPQVRLYRTGDRCRWRADGNLEFLGRIDNQVKLRGFRIELGEIEAVLNEHPSVARSVVQMYDSKAQDKRLVAYCVPTERVRFDVSDVMQHLQSQLPDYMVPTAFVLMDSLPLTPNGKLNCKALPEPRDVLVTLKTEFVAPRNLVEEQLASIWQEILGVKRVGIHDNFFALGGHSLLALRVFARIEQTFHQKLPLAVLFHHGTIYRLAKLIDDSEVKTEIATAIPLRLGGAGIPIFLMPSIGGELPFSQPLIEGLGKRFPVIGIQPSLDSRLIRDFVDFGTTARHFVNAIQSYQKRGPYVLMGYSYGGMMAYEVACVLTQMGEKVDLLAIIDTGPGRRGLQLRFGDRWRKLIRIVTNVPNWLIEERHHFSMMRLSESAGRKLRRVYRKLASGGRKAAQWDDFFNLNQIPSQNQELMQTIFAAFQDYVPRPYPGRLTLLRAQTRPLFRSGDPFDLGWSRFARVVDVHQIKGNHDTILLSPLVTELTQQLTNLLLEVSSKRGQAAHRKTAVCV